MAYAAEHSADVEQARWDLASASADKDEALAAFSRQCRHKWADSSTGVEILIRKPIPITT